MIAYCELIITERHYLTFRNKVVRIINYVPLLDHVTPHMQTLASTDIELPDILKLYTCQLFYNHPIDKKSSNLLL